MNGVSALPDELLDSLKPALASGNFQCGARYKPKRAQAGNIGQI